MSRPSLAGSLGLLLGVVGLGAELGHAAPPTLAGPVPELRIRVEGPAPAKPRAADDFRRSDPAELGLGPVAESSGLSSQTAVQPRAEPLTLAEILDGLAALDPRLAAADRGVEAAEGELLAARGGFDTRLGMSGLIQPVGEYRHGIFDVHVEQATPLWGLSVWTGWRVGLGEFAVYDGKLATAAGGEVRAGASLPLWQGGPIDRTRADIRQARVGRRKASHAREAKQLELEAAAAAAYWKWVSSGLELEIERSLLQLAIERDAGLRRQIELGELEAIVGVDNRRLILDREARVVGAERDFQEAALKLSLFHRDHEGEPVFAGADRLPGAFPEPEAPKAVDTELEVEVALARRPDLAALTRAREQAEVELRYARNQRSARVDLSTWVAQDLGAGATPFEVAALVEIEIPIPLRRGRGRYQAARAELRRFEAELRFARDRVAMEVRDAHSELAAAYQRARLAAEQVELARALAEAELRRFELGAGDLLRVNLRELALTTAQREQVEALAAFFVARARLDVARGQGVVAPS
jgi:cobalt-zinc-cadmium efflux system outer membrane protein